MPAEVAVAADVAAVGVAAAEACWGWRRLIAGQEQSDEEKQNTVVPEGRSTVGYG